MLSRNNFTKFDRTESIFSANAITARVNGPHYKTGIKNKKCKKEIKVTKMTQHHPISFSQHQKKKNNAMFSQFTFWAHWSSKREVKMTEKQTINITSTQTCSKSL